MAAKKMDKFTRAYFEAALWSSSDESDESGGEPLDKNYSIGDFAPETRDKMIADCEDFQERFAAQLEVGDSDQAGHDFWLTRNRHGAGFWDGDWPEPQATELTNGAHEYGEFYLYVGDDGQIHGPPPGAYGVREEANRSGSKKQRREQSTGSFVVVLWTGQEGRFHDMPRARAWSEERLKGQQPGAYAAFYRAAVAPGRQDTGAPWTEPFYVEIVDEYGRIRQADRTNWPNIPSRREMFPHRASEAHRVEAPNDARDILDGLGRYLEHEGHDAAREASRIARLIRGARNDRKVEEVLEEVNKLIGGHGVEAIRDENAWDNYFGDSVATYVNMGDTYETTLLYDLRKNEFHITSWGDWYEKYEQERDAEREEEAPESEPYDEDLEEGRKMGQATKAPSAKAVDFFYKNAGYGYAPGETPEQGRRRTAKALAHAEREASERGWRVEWDHDPEGWDSLGDIDPDTVKEVLHAVLRDENGNVLASLGGIVDPSRSYGRVIEAELALEALNDPSSPGATQADLHEASRRAGDAGPPYTIVQNNKLTGKSVHWRASTYDTLEAAFASAETHASRARSFVYYTILDHQGGDVGSVTGTADTPGGAGMREQVVHDYIAVDRNDRKVAGPFRSQGEASQHVPPGGHVRFSSARHRRPPPAPSSYPIFREGEVTHRRYEFRWAAGRDRNEPTRWEPTYGSSEREAADHLAKLVASVSPVPGKYRAGKQKAEQLGNGHWRMPTGAVVEIRQREQAT